MLDRLGAMMWESPLRQAAEIPAPSYGGPVCAAFDVEHAPAWLASVGLPSSLQTLQAANFLVVNGAMLLVYALATRWPRRPLSTVEAEQQRRRPEEATTGLDRFLSVCLGVPLLAKVAFGVLGNKAISVINPCHVLNAVQWWAMTRRGASTSRAMLMFLPWICGATVAMITPDPEVEFPGEVAQFWVEHAMIAIVAPLYFVVRDGDAASNPEGLLGTLARDPAAFVRGILWYYLQSFLVLMPLARLTTINSNYMLCPPAIIWSKGAAYMTFWLSCAFPVALVLSWNMVLLGRLVLWCSPTLFQPRRAAALAAAKSAKKA
jgi:hypothetical protein